MKFSWLWLSKLVNITDIALIKKLTLAGLEVEEIKVSPIKNDQIIDIAITPNRNDVSSMMGLAREINTLFHASLIPQKIYNYHINEPKLLKQTFHYSNQIKQFYWNQIKLDPNTKYKSPEWMKNYLISCDIQPTNFLHDIQEYIHRKWQYKIYLLNIHNTNSNITIADRMKQIIHDLDHLNNKNLNQILKIYNLNQEIIQNQKIVALGILYEPSSSTYNNKIDFQSAYQETLNLIQTFSKISYGKLNQYSKQQIHQKKYINIHIQQINNILGPIDNHNCKKLSTQLIYCILKQLNFSPIYYKKQKIIQTIIPEYRQHDILRSIDIIEEIARLYGFQFFKAKLPKVYQKGKLDKWTKKIQKIRNTMRQLGFNETLNSSLIDNTDKKSQNKISPNTIYNPLNEYQTLLRSNLLENIINNYLYNCKQQNIKCQFFEIGKVFNKSKNIKMQSIIEEPHLAGLITNKSFLRKSWEDKPNCITWFHFKGILELFFNEIEAEISWQPLQQNLNINKSFLQQTYLVFHPTKTALLYSKNNNKLIGIFGQLNPRYHQNIDIKSFPYNEIFLFEINIPSLFSSIKAKTHLQYITKPYSLYPSIERDISTHINTKINIEHLVNRIKSFQQETEIKIIESIQIFNQYYDIKHKKRFIGLRLKYRSLDKTLNTDEVEAIHNQILEKINSFIYVNR